MEIRTALVAAAAATLLLPSPALAQIQVTPVLTGLTSPLLVTHAGDGLNRLFVVEKGGKIKVVQAGSATPTTFLDLGGKISTTGERGLLGLAFHAQYASNGRFFVYYTRTADGTIVVAEYHVSANRDVADSAEQILLTIPHPTNTNHNGGMLAMGPDGYLYISVGDGGAGNDPPNNAQNLNVLLGKILRIDVSVPGAYQSPLSNPFYGSIAGRDEIFALGFRNPWRFSFDRLTGEQWVGDVGEGSREEVDRPITNGGNYGWKVFEGTACTSSKTLGCSGNYVSPVFEYTHANGRCSVVGGYVYRGPLGTLPSGTFVYGDFCTGEIFTWNGAVQSVLLDTASGISSFGEDEAGEIYVVNINGTVGRLTGQSGGECTYSIAPSSQNVSAAAGTNSLTVTAPDGCGWTAASNASWIHVTSPNNGIGTGSLVVTYTVDPNATANIRTGTMTVAGLTFTVNQSAPPPPGSCTFSLSPTQAVFGMSGGSGTVSVTTGQNCSWTAKASSKTSAAWIAVTGGASGVGNGTVTFSVAPVTGKPFSRSGSLTIAGQEFPITQSP